METAPLNLLPSEEQAGFRLHRFEVFNWGTFHQHVWKLEPRGANALLTGDIGSGKSTLVDALTTLLLPAHRIVYNQAAGAARRERDLLSYVRGNYKTEKDETRFAAKSVYLRGNNTHSVILGCFHNEGYGQAVTLAQVFWSKGGDAQPERFYAVADRPLSISREFSGFGREIADLKRKLRREGVLIFDSFVQYADEFRRRMEIRSDQAMELFYQTVSLKSVGNLTAFIREHMLEEPGVEERLEGIRNNFRNLNGAHEAVLKAKDQIGRLQPLVVDCDRCREVEAALSGLLRCRQALHAFFAAKKVSLLDERISRLTSERGRLADHLAGDQKELDLLLRRRTEIQRSVVEHGGGRLDALGQEIARLEKERTSQEAKEKEYASSVEKLGFSTAGDVDAFHANRRLAEESRAKTEKERKRADADKLKIEIRRAGRGKEAESVNRELNSLRGRETNIPVDMLELRSVLCDALSLEEGALPFVGELLQVREGQSAWKGALERSLRGFGLSLLVPETVYGRVASHVDKTHLGHRLVYFRVREESARVVSGPADARHILQKVDVKPDSPFREWLTRELADRFDYVCCETLEDFQRQSKALTRQGQVKNQGRRHEKDDRFRLDDRSRYVLGWSNAGKRHALEEKLERLAGEEKEDLVALDAVDRRLKALEVCRDAANGLLHFREFQDIDWRSTAGKIADMEEEKRRITEGSDVLRELQSSLAEVESGVARLEGVVKDRHAAKVVAETKLSEAGVLKQEAVAKTESLPVAERESVFPRLAEFQPEALGEQKLTVESCDNRQTEMRDWLQDRHDAENKRRERLREKILLAMRDYKESYALDTREIDVAWEAADEYRALLQRLAGEDLPRHEERFKKLLNENTINDIVLFQNQLEKEGHEIREKITRINRSLKEIEYNAGSFIELALDRSLDAEVQDFQRQLRSCLGRTLGEAGDELYSETKFLEVKALIDRFNGREGLSEADQKWTRKVTDVRHWFEFLVHERWKETGEIRETYSDASGKSGGQKEKLAYTILASALAYQFGLGWGESRSKPFRFVMIDEAFGRGSDESARYALELFKKLNLQLLVVTPLQKIHVIEDYVRSVHFVHNREGKNSMLRNLNIEEYREERARRTQSPAAP